MPGCFRPASPVQDDLVGNLVLSPTEADSVGADICFLEKLPRTFNATLCPGAADQEATPILGTGYEFHGIGTFCEDLEEMRGLDLAAAGNCDRANPNAVLLPQIDVSARALPAVENDDLLLEWFNTHDGPACQLCQRHRHSAILMPS